MSVGITPSSLPRYGASKDPRAVHTSSATSTATVTSLAVNEPAGAVNGDVLVAEVVKPSKGTITPPTGWTQAATVTGPTSSVTVAAYTHADNGSDPTSWTFTISTKETLAIAIGDYINVDNTTPVNTQATNAPTSSGTSFTTPPATTTRTATQILDMWGFTPNTTVTMPSALTSRWNISTSATSGNVTATMGDINQPAAGTVTTQTATTSASVFGASALVALNPNYATTVVRYGYTDNADSPDLTLSNTDTVVERDISLLGGVLVTKRGTPATDVWSYPNIHGDIAATADGSGNKIGPTYTYDPYGNALNGQPNNSSGDFKYGWEGKAERGTDTTQLGMPIIEMGARPYVPALGRFLRTDPMPGGSSNAYDYCAADPINANDIAGSISLALETAPNLGDTAIFTTFWPNGAGIPLRYGKNSGDHRYGYNYIREKRGYFPALINRTLNEGRVVRESGGVERYILTLASRRSWCICNPFGHHVKSIEYQVLVRTRILSDGQPQGITNAYFYTRYSFSWFH